MFEALRMLIRPETDLEEIVLYGKSVEDMEIEIKEHIHDANFSRFCIADEMYRSKARKGITSMRNITVMIFGLTFNAIKFGGGSCPECTR